MRELDADLFALAVDRRNSHAQRQEPQGRIIQQIPHRGWRIAIAVFQLSPHIAQLRIGFHAGNTLVHSQSLVLFRDVIKRDADIEPEVELNFGFVGTGLALHFADRAIQHLRVKLESDCLDVPTLLASEQISRTAQL